MSFDEPLCNGQTYPQASVPAGHRWIDLVEGLKDFLELPGWNPNAVIFNPRLDIPQMRLYTQADPATFRCEADSIIEQVAEGCRYLFNVNTDRNRIFWKNQDQPLVLGIGDWLDLVMNLA